VRHSDSEHITPHNGIVAGGGVDKRKPIAMQVLCPRAAGCRVCICGV